MWAKPDTKNPRTEWDAGIHINDTPTTLPERDKTMYRNRHTQQRNLNNKRDMHISFVVEVETTPRHRTLFWATFVTSIQFILCCFNTASVFRCQLFLGRPLFLFPCGFQVRACRVVLHAGFLRVWPIKPFFLRIICFVTGS
jgi:hypothetical protein